MAKRAANHQSTDPFLQAASIPPAAKRAADGLPYRTRLLAVRSQLYRTARKRQRLRQVRCARHQRVNHSPLVLRLTWAAFPLCRILRQRHM